MGPFATSDGSTVWLRGLTFSFGKDGKTDITLPDLWSWVRDSGYPKQSKAKLPEPQPKMSKPKPVRRLQVRVYGGAPATLLLTRKPFELWTTHEYSGKSTCQKLYPSKEKARTNAGFPFGLADGKTIPVDIKKVENGDPNYKKYVQD